MSNSILARSIRVVLLSATCFTVPGMYEIAAAQSATAQLQNSSSAPSTDSPQQGQPPLAQADAKPSVQKKNATQLQAITVTGYRSSLAKAIAIKKDADTIVDAISAEGIGQYPDINVAESLQRVTGVQISRLSSDGGTANEGTSVSVRGLPSEFNYVSLNGASIASASGNLISQSADRSFDFSVLSPDFISSIEVYKSPKADLTEGAIAATIDVRTVMPLDIGKEVFKGSIAGQGSTGETTPKPNLSLLYSNVNADKTFGATFGFAWNRRNYHNTSYTDAQFVPQTIDGRPYLVLDSLGISNIYNSYDTKTGYAAFQFRPATNLDLSLVALHDQTNNNQIQSAFNSRPQYGSSYSDLVADPNGVLTTQTANGNYFEDQTFNTNNISKQSVATFKVDWRPGNWDIDGSLSYSKSTTQSTQIGIDTLESGNFGIGPSYSGGYSINPGDPIASFVIDPNFNIADPNNYFANYVAGNLLNRGDEVKSGKFDATRYFDDGFIDSVKFGARFQKESISNAAIFYGTNILGHSSIAPFVTSSPIGSASLNGYNGNANVPLNFPYINPQTFLNDNYGGQLTNFQAAYPIGGPNSISRQDGTNQYTITEYDRAAYIMANYKFDGSIPITGNFGVRYVKTGESVLGNTYNLNDIIFIQPAPPPPAPSYIAPPTTPIGSTHSYSDVLPSFNLTANLREDLLLRFAAAETITRPTLADLPAAYQFGGQSGSYVVRSGNPNLDPFKARQLDLSLEWYFQPKSVLSIAPFYKNIETFIQTHSIPIEINGFAVTRQLPVNSTGGHVKGVEADYVQSFDFLPGFWSGFGTQLNATWAVGVVAADPAAGIPQHAFENLSKWTGNATLFWEQRGVSVRLAYNYRSKWLANADVRGTGVTAAYGNSTSFLDFQASYAFNPNFTVFVQATNLLAKAQSYSLKQLYGTSTSYPQTWISPDRRVSAGVRLSF